MQRIELLHILCCPSMRSDLTLLGSMLCEEKKGNKYPIVRGVPVFSDAGENVYIQATEHLSNPIAKDAQQIVDDADGYVLNLSAGGSARRQPKVVELEYSIFRHTDVVGDAHALPFKDNVFAACICMNAFEHYREPRLVALEILRVLKPGGTLFMHTAALQPLHESPHHYYNVTRFGLAEWLKEFDVQHISVSANFNPVYALAWLVSEIERGVRGNQGILA